MVVSPVPLMFKRLLPLVMLPLNVAPPLLLLVIVPAPLKVMFLDELKAELPVIVNVLLPMARFALAPRFASLETLREPAEIVVRPEYVLGPESVRVFAAYLMTDPVPLMVPLNVKFESWLKPS